VVAGWLAAGSLLAGRWLAGCWLAGGWLAAGRRVARDTQVANFGVLKGPVWGPFWLDFGPDFPLNPSAESGKLPTFVNKDVNI